MQETTVKVEPLVLSDQGIVYLSGDIDQEVADNLTVELLKLGAEHAKTRRPIQLRINSTGGDVAQALAIVSTIREVRAMGVEVVGRVVGRACSMAVPILAVCTHRQVAQEAYLLVHGFRWTFGDSRPQGEVFEDATRFAAIHDDIVLGLLASRTKRPRWFWQNWYNDRKEHYLSPDDALGLGLVDEVV